MKKTANLLILTGIIIFIGSAGSSDINALSLRSIFENCLLGAIFVASGYVLKVLRRSVRIKQKCKIYKLFEKNDITELNFPV